MYSMPFPTENWIHWPCPVAGAAAENEHESKKDPWHSAHPNALRRRKDNGPLRGFFLVLFQNRGNKSTFMPKLGFDILR